MAFEFSFRNAVYFKVKAVNFVFYFKDGATTHQRSRFYIYEYR
jgi:hypothetical protein